MSASMDCYRFHLECQRMLEIAQADFERAQARLQGASTAAVHARRAWEDMRSKLDIDGVRAVVYDGRRSPPPPPSVALLGALALGIPGAGLLLHKRTRLRQSARRGRPKDRQFTRKRDGKR